MPPSAQLVIERGPQAGRQITVSSDGVRIGRSSKNDLVLADPLVSRYHCRLFIKPGEGLWVADLGSANQTLVNERPVQEARLRRGDLLSIGDSVLRVIDDATAAGEPSPTPQSSSFVDLGLSPKEPPPPTPPRRPNVGLLLALALLAVAFAVAVWWPRIMRRTHVPAPQPTERPTLAGLEVEYEKVQADTNGIFRYRLFIGTNAEMTVEVDDTEKTHVREQGTVARPLLDDLARFIEESGFFELSDEYTGLQPNVLEQYDLTVTLGVRTHRVRVVNRVPPPEFEKVREKLEEFSRVELGLWAVQYPPEKLVEMARDAFHLGKKLLAERQIAYGNLAAALKSFKEAEFDLKSVEPKPDFYADLLVAKSECIEALEQMYQDHNFLAERAIRVKAWNEAAAELRILCELLPDSDPRQEAVRKKLIEVENRMRRRR